MDLDEGGEVEFDEFEQWWGEQDGSAKGRLKERCAEPAEPLPLGWDSQHSSTGQKYYVNTYSGEVQRGLPTLAAAHKGWETRISTRTGETYYINIYTGASQYEIPTSPVVPAGWKIVTSASTGEVYYMNTETEETRWDPPVAKKKLPWGWEARTSEGTGKEYYFNTVSEESSYDVPEQPAKPLPKGWEMGTAQDTGEDYYTNSITGESQATFPTEEAKSNSASELAYEMRRLKELFTKIDTDGSGTLDRDEVRLALKRMGKDMAADEFDAAFKAMDLDGGGEVRAQSILACGSWLLGLGPRSSVLGPRSSVSVP